MPVYLEGSTAVPARNFLRIGLVNNMAASALSATERQFTNLLERASTGIPVLLSFLAFPCQGAMASKQIYRSTETLDQFRWDGLLVTGCEPVASDLRAEPIWQDFTELVDWASHHTTATVWSCLAAHAAVLHLDGINRERRPEKICGVFECVQSTPHMLSVDTVLPQRTPHSRWNGLSAKDLAAYGYVVLGRTLTGEVDAFLRKDKSLFWFLQGHPEYEAGTLVREYIRDVSRFTKGHTQVYPCTPTGCLDETTRSALERLRRLASQEPSLLLLDLVGDVLGRATVENTWQTAATCVYRKWLLLLHDQKQAALRARSHNRLTEPVIRPSKMLYRSPQP